MDPDRAGPGGGSVPGRAGPPLHPLVGEPPITFLTGWRLALAADLLTETDATLEQIARQVGYGDAFALSTAFRRERGMSPRQYRASPRAAASDLPDAQRASAR